MEKNKPAFFPGFAEALGAGMVGGLYGTGGTLDAVRPSNEENTLSLEAGAPEAPEGGEEG